MSDKSTYGWPDASLKKLVELRMVKNLSFDAIGKKLGKSAESCRKQFNKMTTGSEDKSPNAAGRAADGKGRDLDNLAKIKGILGKGNTFTVHELADRLDIAPRRVEEVLAGLDALTLIRREGEFVYTSTPRPGGFSAIPPEAHGDREILFGVCSDKHMGSKYERLDVLEATYDLFAAAGVTTVYDAGNWIDGEARFNKTDLKVHGLTNQVRYWATHHPKREGMKTYFIAGDDHEGWYHQNAGIEIGKYAELLAQDELKRDDLVYLGYMEHDVIIPAKNDGASSKIRVVHAGGGSSYAISYTTQKLVESLSGGDKPDIMLIGHYHKAEYLNYRNIHCIQSGTTQDQTPFMRKKRLSAHLGGWIVRARQADNGAITSCETTWLNFFDGKYYADSKWEHQS